ncbi:alginate lyase [Erwinia sp. J316]|uniref:Alginate lyase n=2 Tax=Erwinia sorbitola TaxID=2681984 RepID=A0ABW9RD50_9GAMM|nr:alginate lyase [Erwinia sorbitola]
MKCRLRHTLIFCLGMLGSLPLFAREYAFLSQSELALNKTRLQQQQAPQLTVTAWQQLQHEADRALKAPLLSVTDKTLTPPGGSKHDYLSLSAYWWPDEHTADGLPWVRHDGKVNPASKNEASDGLRLAAFTARVQALTLAWYFSADDRYSDRAIALIRHWFIDPDTRMNPNLTYAQSVPGKAENGRRSGVLDGRYFATRIVDSLLMLRTAPGWHQQDEQQMQRWMSDYLHWLQTSPEGKGEAQSENNHGSWYNVQVAGIAWYLRRPEVIPPMLEQAKSRMNRQFAADGSQPLELARTRSFHYSWFNLQALTALATVAQNSGAGDLWHYRTPQQASLLTALEFMAPYSSGKNWPYRSLDHTGVRLIPLLSLADNQLHRDGYQTAIRQADWTLPENGPGRGAKQEALRDTWLLAVPRFSVGQASVHGE